MGQNIIYQKELYGNLFPKKIMERHFKTSFTWWFSKAPIINWPLFCQLFWTANQTQITRIWTDKCARNKLQRSTLYIPQIISFTFLQRITQTDFWRNSFMPDLDHCSLLVRFPQDSDIFSNIHCLNCSHERKSKLLNN